MPELGGGALAFAEGELAGGGLAAAACAADPFCLAAAAAVGAAVAGYELYQNRGAIENAASNILQFAKGKSGARNPAQDKKLSPAEIEDLQNAGIDVHDLKGGKNASKRDLYKDSEGNIYVKPKGGAGPGDPTGININSL